MFPLEKAHVWLCLLSELGLFKLFTFSGFITRAGRCLEEGSPGRGQPVQQAAVGRGMPAEAPGSQTPKPSAGTREGSPELWLCPAGIERPSCETCCVTLGDSSEAAPHAVLRAPSTSF